ncbi:MAG: ion transporter [Bacteroidales bacterium]|nr:ion transporter [Bacteroidales bacterium]
MRKRFYEIIEQYHKGDVASLVYDVVMLIAIAVSIVPLMFMKVYPVFSVIEHVTVTIFIIDYILRWLTADYRLGKGGRSFLIHPFTPWAIIDLLSILPGLQLLGQGFKIFRLTRLMRIVRLLKILRYSDKFQILGRVIVKEKKILWAVFVVSVFYVFLTALIMFNAEPHFNPDTGAVTFSGFFDALYWATVTLTTVGYGDMIPVTDIGRFVSMLSSIFGVAIIALPSGVITASYLDELRNARAEKEKQKEEPENESEY